MKESTENLDVDNNSFAPAVIATLSWVGVGILLDIYLILTRRKRLISDVFRTKAGSTLLIVFCLHIIKRLGKIDPFHLIGWAVESRTRAEIATTNHN